MHGHDGILENNYVNNDKTVEILCKQSLLQAQMGCDVIAPSDMMDGRVGQIRKILDKNNLEIKDKYSFSKTVFGLPTVAVPVPATIVKSDASSPATLVTEVTVTSELTVLKVRSLSSAILIPSSVPDPATKAIPPSPLISTSVPVNWNASAPPLLVTVNTPPISKAFAPVPENVISYQKSKKNLNGC